MRFLDFFAGVGGFRRGLELSGYRCVGFCEWDKYAAASYTSMHLITDEQREYLETFSLKQRQKEILKEEYRNGEWYSNDIRNVDARSLPDADCWCFGAPCQDFSVAGKRAGLDGDRSSLVREVFRILEEFKEEDRPEWLIYENVKGMLSSNRGLDYLSILAEMDRLGYDIEWQNINSKWWVPQNRERIYTIGHLRRYGSTKILPVTGTDGESSVCQIGNYLKTKTRDNPNQGRIYSQEGIGPCLNKMDGGGREPAVGINVIGTTHPNRHSTGDIHYPDGIISCCTSRDYKQPKQIGVKILGNIKCININDKNGKERPQHERAYGTNGIMTALNSQLGGRHNIAIPVLTPDRAEKLLLDVYNFYDKKFIGKDSVGTLTANTGASTTHCGTFGVVLDTGVNKKKETGIYVEMPGGFLTYCVWYEKYQCYKPSGSSPRKNASGCKDGQMIILKKQLL